MPDKTGNPKASATVAPAGADAWGESIRSNVARWMRSRRTRRQGVDGGDVGEARDVMGNTVAFLLTHVRM